MSIGSSNVCLQNSNIILNFRDDFWFLWTLASTDLTSKIALGREVPSGQSSNFCVESVDAGACKNRKWSRILKRMLESCKETFKRSVDSFIIS